MSVVRTLSAPARLFRALWHSLLRGTGRPLTLNLSPSPLRSVDVGDKTARPSATAASSLAVADEAARETCAVHGVPAGRCYDDLEVFADGFCGGGDPVRAWLLIARGEGAKPGVLRAEGWRAVELGDWLRRVGCAPIGPWAPVEVVDDADIEIVNESKGTVYA